MKAICYSERCTGRYQVGKVEKENVSNFQQDCPDCGHALAWKMSKDSHVQRATTVERKERMERVAR